jgi:hypothetical protein
VSSEKDQARLIAERVARRLSGGEKRQPQTETAANNEKVAADAPRARIINFISSGPPVRSVASAQHPPVAKSAAPVQSTSSTEFFQFVPVAQSPWLGRLPSMLANANPHTVDHPSQQRFGVEETTVAELVEFFESEKKCAMDPTGKPCDHCAMCSSRGF